MNIEEQVDGRNNCYEFFCESRALHCGRITSIISNTEIKTNCGCPIGMCLPHLKSSIQPNDYLTWNSIICFGMAIVSKFSC